MSSTTLTNNPNSPALAPTAQAGSSTPFMAGIGGLFGAAGSILGGNASNNSYSSALGAYGNALNLANANNFQEQLQQAQLANYNPAVIASGANFAPNAAANLGPNQQIMGQQMANNAQLQGVAQSGYTPEMMAAYTQMSNANQAQAQSTIKGAQQAAAARGMMASGAAQQAAAGQAAQTGLNAANTASGNIAAQGFQNKMAAMGQLGQLTNAQQAQLSGLAATQAGMTNQYGQALGTLNANIGMQNVAAQNQQQNLQTAAQQQNYNMNTGIANQQNTQNQVGANQTALSGQLAAAGGRSGIYGEQASSNSTATKGAAQGIGTGVGSLLTMI